MEWKFLKTSIVGYGVLYDPKGKKYNVSFDDSGNIQITSTAKDKPVKVPQKVIKMITQKLGE